MSKVTNLWRIVILLVILQVSLNAGLLQGLIHQDQCSTHSSIPVDPKNPILYPTQNNYQADLHWVKTNVTIDVKGNSKVTIVVNCTTLTGHQGIYVKNLDDEPKFVLAESYAFSNDVRLGINITYNRVYLTYLIYLANSSLITVGQNILYYITYETNFYLSGQMSRYQVNTSQVQINLNRPIWDDDLDYQLMRIQLPIKVANVIVPISFLNEINFVLGQNVIGNYNFSYYGLKDSNNQFWFNFELSKNNPPADAAFQAIFYLAISYFSFPMMINWFVITFVSLLTLLALGLFIVLISFKKDSNKEVDNFKKDLYVILKEQENP